MSEGPTSGPRPHGLSERGWRLLGLAIWGGVVAVGVFGAALMALSWREAALPPLGLPELELPELEIPDVGAIRLEAEDEPPAKPGPVPEGMSRADAIPEAQPVQPERLED
ncbi:hypothetical protein [Brevundimonas sp.]|uniref:hypothetical protein n=1 Tax=Brevundimonas sp. TaxID=1871086 RepID=UPI0025F84585|nr:hypothetical protein [Brevundimonas sp.]